MKITLHLNVEEVNAILTGLAELPAKTSMALIQKIHDEATKQTSPKPVEPVAEYHETFDN